MPNSIGATPDIQVTTRPIFDAALRKRSITGFWSIRAQFEQVEPAVPDQGSIWHYSEYLPLAHQAGALIPVEEADRRNLFFANPGRPGAHTATGRLFAGVQVILPGEVAPVHRHTGAACRVLLDGAKGGYTTVEGDRCRLEFGDVVTNPNGAWHENGNDGDETIIWLDVLDIPLTYLLEANLFDNAYTEIENDAPVRKAYQSVHRRDDWSAHAYGGAGGVRPAYASHTVGLGHGAPQMLFKYEPTRAQLDELRDEDGCAWDGLILEYFNAANGGPVMTTMDIHMRMIRKGETTLSSRSTAGTIYCCLEGSGTTVVDGVALEWGEKNVFVVPAWAWHHHQADTSDGVLYSVSDAAMLKKIGLFVQERKTRDGVVTRSADSFWLQA